MMSGPKSDVSKILIMAVVLAIVLGWMAFPRAAKKINWEPELPPPPPVEKEVKIEGLKEQVLKMREEALKSEAPGLPDEETEGEGAATPKYEVGPPEAAAVPLTEDQREEIRKAVEEARSEVERFNEMLPEFDRVEKLDREFLFKVMDDTKFPRAAHDIKSEADVFHHVFGFIRSHTDRELLQMAKEQGDLDPYQMMGDPESYRGRVVRFRGKFVRLYQLSEWPTGELAQVPNTSGVRTTALSYCVSMKARRMTQITAVLTMSDPREFQSDAFVGCPAVFVKRWAAQMEDGRWAFFPLLVAREFKLLPKPRDTGTEAIAWGVAIVVIIGLVVIYLAARYEFSHSAEARTHLRDRLKEGRDKRLEKAKKEGGPMPWEKPKEEPPGKADEVEPKAGASREGDGAAESEEKNEGTDKSPGRQD